MLSAIRIFRGKERRMENETKKNTEMIRKRDERRSWEDVRKTNRQYKSSLFQYLFTRKKEDALSLYNAVNGSNYDNP